MVATLSSFSAWVLLLAHPLPVTPDRFLAAISLLFVVFPYLDCLSHVTAHALGHRTVSFLILTLLALHSRVIRAIINKTAQRISAVSQPGKFLIATGVNMMIIPSSSEMSKFILINRMINVIVGLLN